MGTVKLITLITPGNAANARAPCEEMLIRTSAISDTKVQFVCGRTYHRQKEEFKDTRKAVFRKGKRLSNNVIKYRPKRNEKPLGNRFVRITIVPGPGYVVGNNRENRIDIPVRA